MVRRGDDHLIGVSFVHRLGEIGHGPGTYVLIVTAPGFRPEAARVTVNGFGAVRNFVAAGDAQSSGPVRIESDDVAAPSGPDQGDGAGARINEDVS
jgi:hypothetical protein